jgi:tetratricopeptide (TPR) repeat protein
MEVNECPQCGSPAKTSQRRCEYCKAEFVITNLAYLGTVSPQGVQKYLQYYRRMIQTEPSNAEAHLGLGLAYLQLGLFAEAKRSFATHLQISPEVPQVYYYLCLATVGGRRLAALSLREIRDLEQHLVASLQLDPNCTLSALLLCLIKHEYYDGNGLRTTPPLADQLLSQIHGATVAASELSRLRASVLIRDDFYSAYLQVV